jgi:signal transduction histidine kinase
VLKSSRNEAHRAEDGVNHRRLKWLTFLVASAAVLVLQLVLFDRVFPRLSLPSPLARAALPAAVVVAGVYAFNEYVFFVIARVHAALVQERERLAALHQISQTVASVTGLERNLAATLELARRTLGADLMVWAEREQGAGPSVEAACRVFAGDRQSPPGDLIRLRVGQGVVGRALSTCRPVELPDASVVPEEDRHSYPLVTSEALRSVLAIPTVSGEVATGAVVAGWHRTHRLTAADRAFLENVANQVGTAVANARLYREVQRLAAYEERERLAREMHDGIAQALTYLKLKAEALQQHAGGGRWPSVLTGIEDIRRTAVEALGDVRQAIVDLRAASGRHGGEGFLAHLAEYLHTWSRLNDIECELVAPDGEIHLADEAEIQVVRILQEALANVRQHSGARGVRVRVAEAGQGLTFTVRDDGCGFDPRQVPHPGHFGLAGIRERAESIGGTVEIDSSPGAGTEVRLRLPGSAEIGATLYAQREGAVG